MNGNDFGLFCHGRLPHLLIRLTWKGGLLGMEGNAFKDSSRLTELFLDGCKFEFTHYGHHPDTNYDIHRMVRGWFSEEPIHDVTPNRYILRHLQHLERLSMKGATWSISYRGIAAAIEPIPQEMLMKMVRHHPTLRWLRSDLSEANVAILQQERPEITFVTE
jgi:hypothetical protein